MPGVGANRMARNNGMYQPYNIGLGGFNVGYTNPLITDKMYKDAKKNGTPLPSGSVSAGLNPNMQALYDQLLGAAGGYLGNAGQPSDALQGLFAEFARANQNTDSLGLPNPGGPIPVGGVLGRGGNPNIHLPPGPKIGSFSGGQPEGTTSYTDVNGQQRYNAPEGYTGPDLNQPTMAVQPQPGFFGGGGFGSSGYGSREGLYGISDQAGALSNMYGRNAVEQMRQGPTATPGVGMRDVSTDIGIRDPALDAQIGFYGTPEAAQTAQQGFLGASSALLDKGLAAGDFNFDETMADRLELSRAYDRPTEERQMGGMWDSQFGKGILDSTTGGYQTEALARAFGAKDIQRQQQAFQDALSLQQANDATRGLDLNAATALGASGSDMGFRSYDQGMDASRFRTDVDALRANLQLGQYGAKTNRDATQAGLGLQRDSLRMNRDEALSRLGLDRAGLMDQFLNTRQGRILGAGGAWGGQQGNQANIDQMGWDRASVNDQNAWQRGLTNNTLAGQRVADRFARAGSLFDANTQEGASNLQQVLGYLSGAGGIDAFLANLINSGANMGAQRSVANTQAHGQLGDARRASSATTMGGIAGVLGGLGSIASGGGIREILG